MRACKVDLLLEAVPVTGHPLEPVFAKFIVEVIEVGIVIGVVLERLIAVEDGC